MYRIIYKNKGRYEEAIKSYEIALEIRVKEKQNIECIFLSPLFKNNKNKRALGIYRFINCISLYL